MSAEVSAEVNAVAAIDIGSNSVYLMIARFEGEAFEIVERVKDSARLAAHVTPEGHLERKARERLLETLARFAEVARAHDATVRAVGTATLRRVRDAASIVADAAAVGVPIELISGAEEARLGYLGVTAGLPELRARRILCVDVGGGSTELVIGQGARVLAAVSVPLGSLRGAKEYLGPDPVARARVKAARRSIADRFATRASEFRRFGFEACVATSGTAQRLARMVAAAAGDLRIDVHGDVLSVESIEAVIARLARAPTSLDRLKLPGVDPDREGSILAGALIFSALGRQLGLSEWRVSMSALRTGLLVDTHRRRALEG